MVVLVGVGWLLGWLLLWRVPTIPASTGRMKVGERADVSIVIPARNEERNLRLLLTSITEQAHRPAQILVVDDDSRDATARIASGFRDVTLVRAPELPAGWTGKSWACWTGARHASASSLLFIDADVQLAPGALAAIEEAHEGAGGLLSVMPRHDPAAPREWASLPFNIVALMGTGVGSILAPRRVRSAAGPCVVCTTADYWRSGGHRAVRADVVEDLALGRLFDDHELPVTLLGGGDLVRFRMYRTFRSLASGWSKNFATGARFTPPLRSSAIAIWVTAALTASGTVIGLDLGLASDLAFVAYPAFAAQFAYLGRQVGRFGPAALLWPVAIAFFVLVFAWSTLSTAVLGRVTWSGRRIRTRRPLTAPGRDEVG